MPEVLVPYQDIDTMELATQLYTNVTNHSTRKELTERGQRGVIARHSSDVSTSADWIQKGIDDPDLQAFAIVNKMGNVVGAASIYPKISLRELKTRRFPKIARHIPRLSRIYTGAGPNVFAWTNDGADEELACAYQELATLSERQALSDDGKSPSQIEGEHIFGASVKIPWTMEPCQPPDRVSHALWDANFRVVNSGYFDDGEFSFESLQRSLVFGLAMNIGRQAVNKSDLLINGVTKISD